MTTILDRIDKVQDVKKLNLKGLNALSGEIREYIIKTVARNGGHLASNLGMVEVTIALHYVFNSPDDKIIFDVGHQAYTHKILTSRKEQFKTLRQENGISGFPKREESPHDVFNTGHSSTSISAAVGIARAVKLKGLKDYTIAVIGDGALTGGMAWEALNDLGQIGDRVIIVINDNEMSISRNVGALSRYLSSLRLKRGYTSMKSVVERMLGNIPLIGRPIISFLEKIKDLMRYLFVPNVLFEQMGFKYYGIIDGHNLDHLITTFEQAKLIKLPIVIHVKTKKGKGYEPAEKNPDKFHSPGKFDKVTGNIKNNEKYKVPKELSAKLCDIAEEDETLCVITAAMEEGCGLEKFRTMFPDRLFDVGIAEQHAVTMSAGFAVYGMHPVFCVYSSFLQRAYDQVLHDICLQKLPVTIIAYNTGVVGSDGETHHGIYDISFLRHMPYLRIYAPSNLEDAGNMLSECIRGDCPSVLLIPSGIPSRGISRKTDDVFSWQKYTKANEKKLAMLANGKMLFHCVDSIRNDNLYNYVDVYNARSVKPLDSETLSRIIEEYEYIVAVEDNVVSGGFGSAVLEHLAGRNFNLANFRILGFGDAPVQAASVEQQHKKHGLDSESIEKCIKELIGDYGQKKD